MEGGAGQGDAAAAELEADLAVRLPKLAGMRAALIGHEASVHAVEAEASDMCSFCMPAQWMMPSHLYRG